jgi:tetratricopeptide (TPR) repeat protein
MAVSETATPNAERMGVAAGNFEFSSWGWAFRSQEVEDYGIDAHVEPFDGPSSPTGRLLALQIKSGESYFAEEADGGWWYRGKNRHLRYWLGHVLPVLIVLYDPASRKLYWQHVTEDLVEYTDDAWKILIPRDQVLAADAAGQLRLFAEAAPGASEDPVASSLPFLPPTAAAVLQQVQVSEPDGTMRLARLLAQGREQPRLTVETILAARPSWLAAGNGSFEAAIGAYANEHGHQDLALQAFSRAAEHRSTDAGRLYCVAALLALGQGESAQARDLLRRAGELGYEGLFMSVAVAALADHDQGNDADSPQVAAVLSSASREELVAEPTLVVLLGELAARRGDLAEAIRLFEAASTGSPLLAVARLQLAHALIARAAAGASVVTVSDRLRAQSLAREVQEDTRRWSGPSEKALSVLLKAQMMIGAFQEIIRLATPESLGGAALDREASFGEVAVSGAEAAMAMRARARAVGFGQLVPGSRAEIFIRALVIDPSAPAAEQAAAWRAALASADTMEQQRRALYQLAALGELHPDDLAAGQASRAIGEAQAQILSARNDAAQGRTEQAVMSLRQYADSNSAAAEMLIEVLAGAGRIEDALAECDRAMNRFGAGKTAHDKLNILARAGRLDQADAFATSLLAGSDLAPEQRIMLWQRLIQNRADRGDWPAAENMCREALAENPDDAEFASGLITAQANQGHLDQAWATYEQLNPAVTAPEFVPLWMRLHARAGFTEADVMTALDLVDCWADDPRVGAQIFTVFLHLGGQQLPDGTPVLPELSPEALARFQAELGAYALRYPDGPLAMIDLTDVDLTEVIRAQLVPHAGQLDAAADLVRTGKLPLGALAAAASHPYAAMLIEQSCGIQYAVSPDSDALKREIEVAKHAISGEVVIEASTLALVTLLPQRWPALRSAFRAIRLPRPALADIDNARSELARAPGFSYSIGYDPAVGALVRSEISLAEHQRLHQRILIVEEAARQLVLTDPAQPPGTPDLHQAWSSAISLAKAQGAPLWSDDMALRSMAADQGVPAFGTYALLAALTETGLIPDTTREDAQTLADAQVVELPGAEA